MTGRFSYTHFARRLICVRAKAALQSKVYVKSAMTLNYAVASMQTIPEAELTLNKLQTLSAIVTVTGPFLKACV